VTKESSHYVRLFGGNKIMNLIFWLPLAAWSDSAQPWRMQFYCSVATFKFTCFTLEVTTYSTALHTFACKHSGLCSAMSEQLGGAKRRVVRMGHIPMWWMDRCATNSGEKCDWRIGRICAILVASIEVEMKRLEANRHNAIRTARQTERNSERGSCLRLH
jgi:hypothetical protein